MTNSGIYVIEHTASGRKYVGSAKDFGRRKIEHWRDLRGNRHGNAKLQNFWNKYGEAAFTFSRLEVVGDPSNLIAREQHWIDALDVVHKGFNLAPTARNLFGFKHSQETKEKMSAAHRGRRLSPEHVEATRRGLLGRTMTAEQCEKMRQAKLGKPRGPHSEETRARMSAAAKGRVFSDEHKANLSAAKRRALSTSALATETEATDGHRRQRPKRTPAPSAGFTVSTVHRKEVFK